MSNLPNSIADTAKGAGNYVADSASSAYNTVTGQNQDKNSLTGNTDFHGDAQKLGKDVEKMKNNAMKDVDKKWDSNADKLKDTVDKHKSG
jgi:adenosylcobinamide amidohydrolase